MTPNAITAPGQPGYPAAPVAAPTAGTPIDANVTPGAAPTTGGGSAVATRYDSTPVEGGGGSEGFLAAVDAGYAEGDAADRTRMLETISRKFATAPQGQQLQVSIDDFADLGLFADHDLQSLAGLGLSATEMSQLYQLTANEVADNYSQEAAVGGRTAAVATPSPQAVAPQVATPSAGTQPSATQPAAAQPEAGGATSDAVTPELEAAYATEQQYHEQLVGAFQAAGASQATIDMMLGNAVQGGMDAAGYEELIAYLGTEQGVADIAAYEVAAPAGTTGTAEAGAAPAALTNSGPSAWSDVWADRLRTALKDAGASPQTLVMLMQQLKASKPSEEMLQATLTQLQDPQAGPAIAEMNVQVAKGTSDSNKMSAKMTAGILLGGAGWGVYSTMKGKANLTSQVSQLVAEHGKTSRVGRIATNALAEANPKLGQTAIDAARNETRINLISRADALKAAGDAKGAKAALKAADALAPKHVSFGQALKTGVTFNAPKLADPIPLAGKAGAAAEAAGKGAASTGKAGTAAAAAAKGGGMAAAEAATSGASKLGGGLAAAGKFAAKWLGPIGLAASIGFGAYEVSKTVEAEGGFGEESAKKTGEVAGQTIGTVAGGALGTLIPIPVVGTLVGAALGGWLGGIAGNFLGGAAHDAAEGAEMAKGKGSSTKSKD